VLAIRVLGVHLGLISAGNQGTVTVLVKTGEAGRPRGRRPLAATQQSIRQAGARAGESICFHGCVVDRGFAFEAYSARYRGAEAEALVDRRFRKHLDREDRINRRLEAHTGGRRVAACPRQQVCRSVFPTPFLCGRRSCTYRARGAALPALADPTLSLLGAELLPRSHATAASSIPSPYRRRAGGVGSSVPRCDSQMRAGRCAYRKSSPRDGHLFPATAGNVATLIVTKSPLSPAALGALKDAAKANEFTVLLSPDTVAPSTILEKIVSTTDRRTLDEATTGFYLDLTPPTDARPFFFNQLGFATLFDPNVFSHFTHTGVFDGNLIATLTLAMLVLISVVLVAATIIVPLRSTVREAGWQLAIGGTVYFA
jgi:hypothetical protein